MNADDYRSMMETLYINSHPALKKSLDELQKTPKSEFLDESEIEW